MKKVLTGALVLFLFLGQSFLFAEDEYLYTIGSLGASNLYMTFLTIGLLGDSFEKDVYTAETTKDLIVAIISLTKTSRESLNTLIEEGEVAGEDRATILEMIQAHGLLEKQAGELGKYVDNKTIPNDFQFFRKKSWELIAKILNIPQ